ncbi:hypothetical protein [Myceligenerans indicum]|uniref:Uncharacterized protein n=1 Tax=Myceligenerans indicum TaxID=2593663 RepID=A0ABS1LQS1_9MICO|nr:hypothetical protein [Myceligenerans indicum]MBL0888627.1 hypothetical protein [Myceligenerans indicum]
MAVSMKKMSAGDGYRYFMGTVATGDVGRSMSTPLTQPVMQAGLRVHSNSFATRAFLAKLLGLRPT